MSDTTTGNDVQASMYAYLKTKSSVTSLLDNANQIKENQWQGTDFLYPAIRISVDFYPSVNRCQERAEVHIRVLSEEKSSDETSRITGAIQNVLHRKPFSFLGVNFFSVIVDRVTHPERSIYAWESELVVTCLLA